MLAGAVSGPVGHVEHDASSTRGVSRRTLDDPVRDLPASVALVALLLPWVAVVVVAELSQKPGLVRVAAARSPRTHLALFQKYRCGTSSRAGPPCSGSSGSPSYAYAIQALPLGDVREREVGGVAAVAEGHDVRRRSGSTPLSSVSTETPAQLVSSFDHLVTQWMSTVTVSRRQRRNSSHVQRPRLVHRAADREVPLVRAACAASARPTAPESRRSGTGPAAPARGRHRGGRENHAR